MDFLGSTALVTGAAQGIGRAVSEQFAAQGARVLAVDVSPGVRDLAAVGGGRVEPYVLDLADAAAVAGFAAGPLADAGVDLLVNCAAAYPPGGLLESTDADWQRVLQVGVLAPAALCRAVARGLIRRGAPGAVVNVGSVQEALPLPGHAAYVAAKGGLSGLTSALAVELADHGIRVNAVTVSLVQSAALTAKLGDGIWAEEPPPTLLGRTGTPDEAAAAITYLCSPRASFVTGAVLAVDGGRRLSRRPDAQLGRREPHAGDTADDADTVDDRTTVEGNHRADQ